MKELLPEGIRIQVLEKITPTAEEIRRQKETIQLIKTALSELADEKGYRYSFIEAEGSTGQKQTQIRGAADLDIFIGLRQEDYRDIIKRADDERDKRLSREIENLVEDWFRPAANSLDAKKVQKTYAQHPYLSFILDNMEVDLVACFAITAEELAKNGPITAVDRTYHHTKYILNHIDEVIRENIRMLKAFTKASQAYGDTCAVGRMGFTGYVLENICVISGTFSNALQIICNLADEPIDPLERGLEELKKIPRFRDDRYFVIDPTDTSRNAASSLSSRTYKWMVISSKNLLDNIRNKKQDTIVEKITEMGIPISPLPDWLGPHIFIFELESIEKKHYTIVRDKLYSIAELMERWVAKERTGEERFGKVLAEVHFKRNRYAIGCVVEKPHINETFERRGPPTRIESACESFKRANPKAYEREGYLWVSQQRKYTDAKTFAERILQKKVSDELKISDEHTRLSAELKTVLYRYVMPAEDVTLEPKKRLD
ncbi:MAG: hypothetical protein BAJATHORv1_10355 [Candidatus Thorarchaeota archaeon]|nr:MAG: hypothetical protein BAJATHORv1_10355 [Candidatus Thorarchaeota archaeon]